MQKTRTRFAPSPTGYMHVGNLRSALYTFLIAKIDDGTFVLRIEDTDRERFVDDAVNVIYQTLKETGLIYDEGPDIGGDYGPYIQSERSDYLPYAKQLIAQGDAYYCFCSEERLENLRKTAQISKQPFRYDGHCRNLSELEVEQHLANNDAYVIRQKMPLEGKTVYDDLVYGRIAFDNSELEDQILIKSDGYPTYNFANVIDDHLMNITHVVRGNEYLTSTPKYTKLYNALGFEEPIYVHLPTIVNHEGKKLSKRNNDASYQDLVKRGFLAEAIINYLALLGWSPQDNVEIFSLEELISKFSIERISKAPSVFDVEKLKWINAKYINALSDADYLELVMPYVSDVKLPKATLQQLVLLYKKQLSYGEEIKELIKDFNACDTFSDELVNILKALDSKLVLESFLAEISKLSEWTVESVSSAIAATKQESNVKGKQLFKPLRIASTISEHGPELASVIYLTGQDRVIANLNQALSLL